VTVGIDRYLRGDAGSGFRREGSPHPRGGCGAGRETPRRERSSERREVSVFIDVDELRLFISPLAKLRVVSQKTGLLDRARLSRRGTRDYNEGESKEND
jgi:hypothetical protein